VQYPGDSAEELFAKFTEAAKDDEALMRSVANEAFRGIVSDLYDEDIKTSPDVPPRG
jgi:hypothetical protein